MKPLRTVILVIDGLGVGAMPDVPQVRPEDAAANTIKHVAEKVEGLKLPNLEALGLGNVALDVKGLSAVKNPMASYGTCMLRHVGADTYLGHQEIMGTLPREPMTYLLNTVSSQIEHSLIAKGHKVTYPFVGKPLLLVDDRVVIGDNLESDAGRIINVTAPLDFVSFKEALAIGEIVRGVVKVSRVIVLGSTGYGVEAILRNVETRPQGQIGVNSPALGVYNEDYQAKNLGYTIEVNSQISTILTRDGYDVTLIGKAVEVIQCDKARCFPESSLNKVFTNLSATLKGSGPGLIVANIQDTDLAGHDENPQKFAEALSKIDEQLIRLLHELADDDILIITADHGNDPTDGSGKQTRELTPLLVYGSKLRRAPLGIRKTLADTAATISDVFNVSKPESGTSFYTRLVEL